MIELLDLSRSFDKKEVLRDLSFRFPDKGAFAIMGPSGVGKTTLLRLLSGLDRPDKGELISTHTHPAMSFQEPRLLPWLTCHDNLTLVLGKREKAAEAATEWLERFELAEYADRYPHELSGGMQQRLSLARALCYGGDLYLFDEPFSALDQALRERIAPYIRALGEKALLIIVTHDRHDAALLGATVLTCDGEPISALCPAT